MEVRSDNDAEAAEVVAVDRITATRKKAIAAGAFAYVRAWSDGGDLGEVPHCKSIGLEIKALVPGSFTVSAKLPGQLLRLGGLGWRRGHSQTLLSG